MEDRKKHAHFQDQYRRSSNFGKMDAESRPDEDEEGNIELEEKNNISKEDIRKTVDSISEKSKKSGE